ncbi:MAG TPA: hypothetical protein VE915_00510 [Actinomycetota bacterium]|jgi:hypothetical protein|nr:hypothetical protein [Actinomycetota bacterium]
MKPITIFFVAAVLLGSGCAKRQEPASGPEEGPDPATSRVVSIYEAVIRQLVTTSDSTFGANPQFPVIFLLERARKGAANPELTGREGTPLSAEVKRGLLAALSDLTVKFVSDEDAVIIPVEEGGGVEQEGVVVTVGPIPEGEEQVEVEASLYAGPLAATWLTYVVKRSSQGWRVTGTTGPVAIS